MGHYPARCGVREVSNWIFYQHWISTGVRLTKPEACSVVRVFYLLGLGYSTVATDQSADMLDHLASANPVSLCDPMACGKGRQPTREGNG
uniref:Transposase n=1 Tax=Mesocestoides corti TaxID=53468 RepID=A0A5K3G5Y3_MESCO